MPGGALEGKIIRDEIHYRWILSPIFFQQVIMPAAPWISQNLPDKNSFLNAHWECISPAALV